MTLQYNFNNFLKKNFNTGLSNYGTPPTPFTPPPPPIPQVTPEIPYPPPAPKPPFLPQTQPPSLQLPPPQPKNPPRYVYMIPPPGYHGQYVMQPQSPININVQTNAESNTGNIGGRGGSRGPKYLPGKKIKWI